MNCRFIERPKGIVDAVLDTDAYNEIDDQFAIAYLLRSQDRVNLRAIYSAPFKNARSLSPQNGMEKSYEEIKKLLWLAERTDMLDKVYQGAERWLPNELTPVTSPATEDLIAKARQYTQDKPLYVLSIGAITNIASALISAPDISDKVVIIWLGGHAYHYTHNNEFNCKQDVAAARVVFDSRAPLVQLPCFGVVDALATTEHELRHWLGSKNALCSYLSENTIEEADSYAKGKPWSRVIWDISAVAWILDTDCSMVSDRLEPRPILEYDHHYSFDPTRPMLNYVYRIHRDRVFEDLFNRLTS